MRLIKEVCGTIFGVTEGTTYVPKLTSIPWSPLVILLMTRSDTVVDEVDGAELWGSREMDEVVGGS